VRSVAVGLRRITVRPEGPVAGRAHPGTHIDVRVRIGDTTDVRSYSVVESSDDGSEVTITVMLSPHSKGGSRFMHGIEVGDVLDVTQPLQNFPLSTTAPRHVLLAGGVGVTALVEAARVLKAVQADYRMVYVGRSRSAMAYAAELEKEHEDRLDVFVDDEGRPLDVRALVGSIADGELPGRTELYMCGPIRLMDAVRRAWAERQLPPQNLRFETFGNSGWFEQEAFVIRVPRLGIEATVGVDTTLLEGLVEAGVDVMWDCRKGECGLCEVRVQDVHGVIDHRDVFLSDVQKDRHDRLCICVSRVAAAQGGPRDVPPVLTLRL
jgi:ferredoxin-NADP reductase